MLLTISMALPEAPTAASGIDTSPRSVNEWVEALPRANTGGTTREILQALQSTNSAKLPLEHRLHFLESVAGVIDELMPLLERHFADTHWPFEEKAMRVAQLTLTLRQELATGYRLVLGTPRPWGLFRRAAETHARAAARTIRIVSDVIEQCRLLHQPEPAGAWSVMHQAFLNARENRETEFSVTRLNQPHAYTTVALEYRRVLLRSLLSPADFTKEQWRNAHERLDEWAALVRLTPPKAICSGTHCVHIDADIGPAAAHSRCTESCGPDAERLQLETSELMRLLDVPSPPIPTALAEALVRAWREPGERAEKRTATAATMDGAFGFTAIHSLMLQKAHEEAATQAAKAPDWAVEGEQKKAVSDTWGSLFIDTIEYQRSNWAEAFGHEQNYDTQPVRMENSSRNGQCLTLPKQLKQPLRVGDIAGFRHSAGDWEIGAVRWVHARDRGNGNFGVRRLMTEASAIVLRVFSEDRCSDPLPGFAGIGPDGERALLVPYIPGRRKRFVLDKGESGHVLETDEILSSGTHYVLYKFHIETRWESNLRLNTTRQNPIGTHGVRDLELDVWRHL